MSLKKKQQQNVSWVTFFAKVEAAIPTKAEVSSPLFVAYTFLAMIVTATKGPYS
jgi:hypothetical protein